jgi:hypothetical protein
LRYDRRGTIYNVQCIGTRHYRRVFFRRCFTDHFLSSILRRVEQQKAQKTTKECTILLAIRPQKTIRKRIVPSKADTFINHPKSFPPWFVSSHLSEAFSRPKGVNHPEPTPLVPSQEGNFSPMVGVCHRSFYPRCGCCPAMSLPKLSAPTAVTLIMSPLWDFFFC